MIHALRLALVAIALVCSALAPSSATSATASAPATKSPTTLGAKLRKAGSARVTFVRISEDPTSDTPRSESGWLELQPPGLARLEFSRTGEKVTLRPDGGEWLQPRLHQMITLDSLRAAAAGRWWQLLMDGHAPGIAVSSRGTRAVAFLPAGDAGPDSAVLRVDAAGLPAMLSVTDATGESRYTFSNWTFLTKRGPAAYRQHAPPGFEVVPLP